MDEVKWLLQGSGLFGIPPPVPHPRTAPLACYGTETEQLTPFFMSSTLRLSAQQATVPSLDRPAGLERPPGRESPQARDSALHPLAGAVKDVIEFAQYQTYHRPYVCVLSILFISWGRRVSGWGFLPPPQIEVCNKVVHFA